MKKYFTDCQTINSAKKLYHELLKKYHPDKKGDTRICQEIIGQFEDYIKHFTNDIFTTEENIKYNKFEGIFSEILNKIIHFENMEIQIIGYWIYTFRSYEYKEHLKELGFWFSKKHRAWIFSGTAKKKIRSKLTTDDVRNIHGFVNIEPERILKLA